MSDITVTNEYRLFQRREHKNGEAGAVDSIFLSLVLILVVFGLVMMFSASYPYCYYYFGNSYHYIIRQTIMAAAGIGMMIFLSSVDYHKWHKLAYLMPLGVILLLVVVFFFPSINGAHRWIDIGITTFQPSEIAKFSLIVFFAHHISCYYTAFSTASLVHRRFKEIYTAIGPLLLLSAIYIGLVIAEPHLSCSILLVSLCVVLLFIGGIRMEWIIYGAVLLGLEVLLIAMIPSLRDRAAVRFAVWLNPFSDPTGDGYQTVQSLYAIGSGGWWGLGFGNSRQKLLYIPEPHNDFIFAIVCEELGFVGALMVIILFAVLIVRGMIIAYRAKDQFGKLLASGLTAQVGIQAALNIMVTANLIPNTGISLPFFSYGGTALMMLLAEMGIVLSVSRQTKKGA